MFDRQILCFIIHFNCKVKLKPWTYKTHNVIPLFSCNTARRTIEAGSSSLSHNANNVFARNLSSLPIPSNTRTPRSSKPSEVPHPSSTITKVFININATEAILSSSLPSKDSGDDTSELSGLYHLISFEDVDASRKNLSHLLTPSLTVSRRYEGHSRHRDLATMLAELAETSSRRVAPTTVSSAALWSVFLGKQGMYCSK